MINPSPAVLDPADHALLVDDENAGNAKVKRSIDINVPWLHKAEYIMSEKLSGVSNRYHV